MLHVVFRGIIAIVLSATLIACGGGGGSSDTPNNTAPDNNNGTVTPTTYNRYLPAGNDIRLYYNNNGAAAYFSGDISVNGTDGRILSYPGGGRHYFQSTEDRIALLGYFAPEIEVSGIGVFSVDLRLNTPVVLWQEGMQASSSADYSGTGTVDISPTYGQRDITFSGSQRIWHEEIETPFGPAQAKVVSVYLSANTTIDGASVVLNYEINFWLVENIGVARLIENNVYSNLSRFTGNDPDGDGVPEPFDLFPEDSGKTYDTDNDGIANEEDPDDDNDGTEDTADAFPLDPTEQKDTDGDGVGDNRDYDIDGDGYANISDAFPSDPSENSDWDGDGIGDNADPDDDNDGVDDETDLFPRVAGESTDFDNDGMGDNGDRDDDNDGVDDVDDYYPFDASRHAKLALTNAAHAITYVRGSPNPIYTVTTTLYAPDLDWDLGALASGISADQTSGSGSGAITFTIDMTQVDRAVAEFETEISVLDSDDRESVRFDLTHELPAFTFAQEELELDAQYGWDETQAINQLSLNTGSNRYAADIEVTFPIAESWTAPTALEVSGEKQVLSFEFDPSKFSEGLHEGLVTVTTEVDGETITGSFILRVKASTNRLVARDIGVSLSHFPGIDRTQHAVLIDDSYWIGGIPWTASTDAEWLHIDDNGVTGEPLNISALTDGLLQDTLYLATINISSTNPAIEGTEKIHVGLWVGSADPEPKHYASVADDQYRQIAADPLRPFLYASRESQVDIYNVYTGELVDSKDLNLSVINSLTVSSDGKFLYASSNVDKRITQVALHDWSENLWQFDSSSTLLRLRFGRVNGTPFVVPYYASSPLHGETGAAISQNFSFGGDDDWVFSPDGRSYCHTFSSSIRCDSVTYSSLSNTLKREFLWQDSTLGGNDVAISNDGKYVYTGDDVNKFDALTGEWLMELPVTGRLMALDAGPDGELAVGTSWVYGELDFWRLDSAGNVTLSDRLSSSSASILQGQMYLSADGLMTMALFGNSDKTIVFSRNY